MTSSGPSPYIEPRPQAAPGQIIHASLPLYILVERRPTPDSPDLIEVGCGVQNGAGGIVVYRSPVDAMLDQQMRNRNGRNFYIVPFESIDPRPHLRDYNYWLTVYMVYGFAARGHRLVLDAHGVVQSLVQGTHFHIAPEEAHHFHLYFRVEWMETLHAKVRIHDYDRMVQELGEASTAQIDRLARTALQRIDKPVSGGDITHCALYDHIEQRWRFVANEDVELPGVRPS